MFASKDLAIASTAQGWDEPTNTPNPILVRFRKWVEGETLSDPCWAEEWLAAMGDPDLVVDAGRALDEVYAIPYLRGVRAAQELHARAVLTRLHRLAVAASEMSL